MTGLAVIGGGTTGRQIAQQAALQRIEVALQDVSAERLERGVASAGSTSATTPAGTTTDPVTRAEARDRVRKAGRGWYTCNDPAR